MIDIVTVYHNENNKRDAFLLGARLHELEGDRINFVAHSNIEQNLGFAKGCNRGAALGDSQIIGFLNPDVVVKGPFVDQVVDILSDPAVVITGCRFGKPQVELNEWGVRNWVCGATFFVEREWFEKLGGFDERYEWSHEETDFIRATERLGGMVKEAPLPFLHASPTNDNARDAAYKVVKFEEARAVFRGKWG